MRRINDSKKSIFSKNSKIKEISIGGLLNPKEDLMTRKRRTKSHEVKRRRSPRGKENQS